MSVSTRFVGAVAECCLQQPPCNEIGLSMVDALTAALDEVSTSDARVLIFHSMQPGFSAGADLRALYNAIAGRPVAAYRADLVAFLDRINGLMTRIDTLPMPTVAAVHGVCFGGGFELALTCDVIIADRSARFCFPECRLGLIPGFGGVPRLKREVPNAVVRDLLLSGRSLSARRAGELGIAAQVVGEGNGLSVARDCARQMALFAPEVLRSAKRFVKSVPEAELQEERDLFLSLFEHPRVEAALREFVARTDAMPYQPRNEEPSK